LFHEVTALLTAASAITVHTNSLVVIITDGEPVPFSFDLNLSVIQAKWELKLRYLMQNGMILDDVVLLINLDGRMDIIAERVGRVFNCLLGSPWGIKLLPIPRRRALSKSRKLCPKDL
jgi:hypothetical protein